MKDSIREAIANEIVVMKQEEESSVSSLVQTQQQEDIKALKDSDEFKNASKQLAEKKLLTEFESEALKVLGQENRNQLEKYMLKKEKERLDYITEKEKPLIKEKAKAELMEQKRKIAIQRYGYLYKKVVVEDINENGEKIQKVEYKDFTASKPLNIIREFAFKYNNLSETAKKFIWTTLKVVIIVGLIALGLFVGYKLIMALVNSGVLNFAK